MLICLPKTMRGLWIVTILLPYVASFSLPIDNDSSFRVFDKFEPNCPADSTAIQLFDSSLIFDSGFEATWVAVYRSANNKPSVLANDEFLRAMKYATSKQLSPYVMQGIENGKLLATEPPVAIARLVKSNNIPTTWILDTMRCILKKETLNPDCDGGSEHTEALGVAIDSILIHHLWNNRENDEFIFEGTIRTKATLVSAPLLESRGFQEITTLSRDMTTHVCSLDNCLDRYANRAVSSLAKGTGARERALQIVSLLGQIDRDKDLALAAGNSDAVNDKDDPWAGANKFFR
jgi:hypothetical protein